MSTSQKTFDQVKSILGKLDQRIDALRQRRSTPEPVPATVAFPISPNTSMPAAPMPAPVKAPVPAHHGAHNGTHATPAPAAVPPAPSRSPYGRATPIRGN